MDGFAGRTQPYSDLTALFAARAAGHDREASFPHDNMAHLAAEGLLAFAAAPEQGGGGAGLVRCLGLIDAVAQGCASTALILAMQLIHTHLPARNPRWPARLRAQVASDARDGGLINALRVEPDLGTPARGGLPATIARRTAAGWSLTGHKIYATGAPGLRWMLVFARTDDPAPQTGNFLVPASAPGVRIEPTWDQLGLRATGSHDVHFTDVAIPADHAVDLRAPAEWVPSPTQVAWNTLTIAALYTGVATAARDWLVGFLRARTPSNLGAPLATLPRMQEAVGQIEALLLTNRRLVASAAEEYDRGNGPDPDTCNLIKTVAAENAIAAVEEAVKLAGNTGLARAHPLERHLRDVLCARIHSPQADSAHIAAGKAILLAPEPAA